ncbi:MAG: hypothetical protein H8E41_08280 [Desulfobulbaceae bacterium]|uniref:Tetratricopeptide repeat protein n=1 Tax=Candidatus Desulfobia pelagia TaxID=2841692 RepID=A0A8J6NBT9_9BACT|nr:hypothetical protein [Candidatus Desulfobia pelagia]
MKEYRTIFLSLFMIFLFCGCGGKDAAVQSRDVYEVDASSIASLPPSKHLIPGVPFVSWSEAASMQYANKEVLNPSSVAATLMSLKFWLPGAGIEDTAISDGWMRISREKANLETLKKIVADDLPVHVPMALTPFAHPVTADAFLSGLNQLLPADKGPYGGALGELMPLPVLEHLAGDTPGILISQSSHVVIRLVVGFDDTKKVFIIHDPTFGPAWEVSYDDFDRMWAPWGRKFDVVLPPNWGQKLMDHNYNSIYQARSVSDKAAFHYVHGVALASVGLMEESFKHLEEGVAFADLSDGYRFLFLKELALYYSQKDLDKSIELAEQALEIIPEDYSLWWIASILYTRAKLEDKAGVSRNKANSLASDQKALKKMALSLPKDFWIEPLANIRGWGFDLQY